MVFDVMHGYGDLNIFVFFHQMFCPSILYIYTFNLTKRLNLYKNELVIIL
jgi:hypothetical protein